MIAILQAAFSLLIGWGVFLLWRRVASASRFIYWVVTIGVLLRAVGGQLAFWLSYLNLPVARSLQLGNGLWIFAVDATAYFDNAVHAAGAGPLAILTLNRMMASVFFVQVLATFVMSLGAVTSVAILLNVAAYLGCCRCILSFSDTADRRAIAFAIAAVSLSPSSVAWSVQPLKDTLFLFLVAAFFAAARQWQLLWRSAERPRLSSTVVVTLAFAALLYAISGIRWYYGLFIVLTAIPFVLLTVAWSRQRLAAAIAGIVLIPLLGVALFAGAGPYLPNPIRHAILHREAKQEPGLPRTLLKTVTTARENFQQAGGDTMIGAGNATQRIEAASPKPQETLASMAPQRAEVPARPAEDNIPHGESIVVPASPLARMIVGTAAIALPRFVAQRLGILEIRGGRGLWLFVELDTLQFDLVLIGTLLALLYALRRRVLRIPLVWMAFPVAIALAGALAYAVTNFGTLFRHRNMILLSLALLPLVVIEPRESARA